MPTKTVIRYKPYSPLVGRRELSPKDFESMGIFTQRNMLVFDKERNWWLDAEAAGISKEALQWFDDSPEFTVERQEVPDDADAESLRHKEAYAASLGSAPQPSASALTGQSKSETTPTGTSSTTTQSTAKA
jgi:hypothetical protein